MSGMATALCAAISIGTTGDTAPDWLHLLPAGEVRTHDQRGPYRIGDVVALMSASMTAGKLVLDENHATDLAAPAGQPAPARGWIVELQQRADGVWGRVEWTPEALQSGIWRAYRGVSPVIAHLKDKTITRVLRASLTNTPNFAGLVALHHQEKTMDFRAWLIEALGLEADVADDAIVAAMKKRIEAPSPETALQSALGPIALAAGLAATADASAVLAGVQQLRSGGSDTIAALQSELSTVTTSLNALKDANTKRDATAFVDAAIAAGRVGVKAQRAEYISMHMENPTRTEKLINAIPAVKGGATLLGDPKDVVSKDGIGAADEQVIALMGLDRASYAAELAAARGEIIA